MKNRGSIILKNGIIGFGSQIITALFAFVTRSLFLHHIGAELLGINSVFASALAALSLTELGFQTAIVYMLYEPLNKGDKERINAIVCILKRLYETVGVVFMTLSFAILPFLRFILKGVDLTVEIYVFFLLQSLASTCTYFMAYRRSLLYADQKDYVSKFIDVIVNTLFNIILCIAIIVLKSYWAYLIIKVVQVVVANLIISVYCKKNYDYLHRVPIDKTILKDILGKTKNVFIGRFAGFIYSSTDNLVISSFISASVVAFYGNYLTVLVNIRSVLDSAMNSMVSIVGNYMVENSENSEKKKFFLLYSHIRYYIALIVVVPLVVLLEYFIEMWVGKEYILPTVITYLMGADLYIHLVHAPAYEFVTASGLFKEEKNIEIAGAISNITLSVIGVKLIGIPGVLLGTVVSQSVFWIGRSWLAYKTCLQLPTKEYVKYWMREAYYLAAAIAMLFICKGAFGIINIENMIMKFIVTGVVCEVIIVIIAFVVLNIFEENKKVLHIFSDFIKRKMH